MKRTEPQHAPQGIRLIRLLAQLGASGAWVPESGFAERMGRLLDFADSIRLSAVHDDLRRLRVEPDAAVPADGLRQDLLQLRLQLVQSVVESFAVRGGNAKVRLPSPRSGLAPEKLVTFEPYHRFYAAHQREFEARIQAFQLRAREKMSAASTPLARLAALDEALRDTLSVAIRRRLAVIPQLLGQRFDALLREQGERRNDAGPADHAELPTAETWEQWRQPGGWLGRFLQDMQGLLLAELELRLLPVLGLIEAVDEEVERG